MTIKYNEHTYKTVSVITKTCLYNFDPLKPHFYIVKLGCTGVYIMFLISAQKHTLWYSLEPPQFYYMTVGFKRVNIIQACFRDVTHLPCIDHHTVHAHVSCSAISKDMAIIQTIA